MSTLGRGREGIGIVHADPRPAGLSAAGHDALKWMRARGGDAAVVRERGGGRYILASGEQAPFLPATCRALIDAGYAEYVDQNGRKAVRFRLTDKGRSA